MPHDAPTSRIHVSSNEDYLMDCHCHLGLYDDPERVLARAHAASVGVVTVTNRASEYRALRRSTDGILGDRLALGLHPECAGSVYEEQELKIFAKELTDCWWIGEIGLDGNIARHMSSYFGGVPSLVRQEHLLDKILALGIRDRPMSVHSQGAEEVLVATLLRYGARRVVFHWFVGSRGAARRIADNGYFVSVNAAMLASRAGRALVKWFPLERLLMETDGPFTMWEGKVSEPADLPSMIEAVAELKGRKAVEVGSEILRNFHLLEGEMKRSERTLRSSN